MPCITFPAESTASRKVCVPAGTLVIFILNVSNVLIAVIRFDLIRPLKGSHVIPALTNGTKAPVLALATKGK